MGRSTRRSIVTILFVRFIDSVAEVKLSGVGCYVNDMYEHIYCCMLTSCWWPHLLPLFSVFWVLAYVNNCEADLDWLDMRINPKKSCIRLNDLVLALGWSAAINQRSISDDSKLPWAITLDTFVFISGHKDRLPVPLVLQCTLCVVLSRFNAVFGKVGRIASPDVVVQLVNTKCLPILCYPWYWGMSCQ